MGRDKGMTYYIKKKFHVSKSRMNKVVFSWPFTQLRREVVNISQFPTVPNSVLQLGMLYESYGISYIGHIVVEN